MQILYHLIKVHQTSHFEWMLAKCERTSYFTLLINCSSGFWFASSHFDGWREKKCEIRLISLPLCVLMRKTMWNKTAESKHKCLAWRHFFTLFHLISDDTSLFRCCYRINAFDEFFVLGILCESRTMFGNAPRFSRNCRNGSGEMFAVRMAQSKSILAENVHTTHYVISLD